MTDKELIQALRHCASDDEYGCLRCPGEATCDECSGKSLLDAADRLEALLAENEHLREVTKMAPQWVSVKDQLPGNDGRYLCVKRIREDGPIYVTILNWDCDGFYWEYTFCNDVTHWMCLPTPPRTEGWNE